MIEPSSVVFPKIPQIFHSFRGETFRENSRPTTCIYPLPRVSITEPPQAFIKRRYFNWIRSESTRRLAIGNHDFPSLCSVSHLRIMLGMYLHPFHLSSRSFFLHPFAFSPSAFHSPNKSLNESPLTLNYYYLSLYRLTLYSIVSLQKYIYYFSALWLLKTYR